MNFRRMLDKLRDEHEALMICRDKVAQRGLPMAIVDAEYQWWVLDLHLSSTASPRIKLIALHL